MLGFVCPEGRGAADLLLAEVAERLRARGVRLAGAVQINVERVPGRACDMNLHALAGTQVIRISQSLGPGASGCRLDPDGLERTVALVEQALAGSGPDLVILNKFGKQEAEGRGFRPLIGAALAQGVPVLTAVRQANRAAFECFAEGIAEEVPADAEAVLAWCDRAMVYSPVSDD